MFILWTSHSQTCDLLWVYWNSTITYHMTKKFHSILEENTLPRVKLQVGGLLQSLESGLLHISYMQTTNSISLLKVAGALQRLNGIAVNFQSCVPIIKRQFSHDHGNEADLLYPLLRSEIEKAHCRQNCTKIVILFGDMIEQFILPNKPIGEV